MTQGFTVKLSGFEGVAAALAELPKATSKNTVRRALKTASEPMLKDAAARAPKDEGDLRDSFVSTVKIMRSHSRGSRRPGRDEIRLFLGPNYNPGEASFAPHAHLTEFGTGPRFQKTTGRYVGQVAPRPYMRPAFDTGKDRLIRDFSAEIWTEINKAQKRIARKNARLLRNRQA